MKRYYILSLICCTLIACKKTNVDFNYSPEKPRAGETVNFSNISNDGEEWAWTFGDGATGASKSPTHIYRQPGTYTVVLQVDERQSLTRTKDIVIYDTIPNFVCSDTADIHIFEDVTFEALVYNPYDYPLSYQWSIPSKHPHTLLSDSTNGKTYTLYFSQAANKPITVQLQVVLNGDTTTITHDYTIVDIPTKALLLRTTEQDYAQRIFGQRNEQYRTTNDDEQIKLLNQAQENKQTFNGKEFTLASLSETFPGIQGFQIANRKLYYRTNGLYVADLNGNNIVQIDDKPTHALCVDIVDNRLYWAVADSVLYMPLVSTENNQFTTKPTTINTLKGVNKLTIDATPR